PRARSARSSVPIIEAALEQGRDRLATALLDVRGRAEIATLDAHSRGGNPEGALVADGWALSPASVVRLSAQAVAAAIDFQNHNPLRPGIPKASLASSLGIDFGIMQALIGATPELVDRGADVATADFSSTIGQAGEAAFGEVEMKLRSAGLAVPRIAELGIPLDLLHALVRLGRLVRISEDLVYLPEQLHELQERLAELPPEFTVAQFRDMSGTSRKYAVPLLEWFDDQRITHRRGDLRVVKPS
ncbi:MAG TPA: SelB C-terminal domain-containing protein, partial [Acidimicrobiia bacterium]